MNTQINLRIPEKLLNSVRSYSDEHGFGSIQDFITETIREKLFDHDITKEELILVKKLAEVTEKKKLYGTEKELFQKLRRK